MSLICLLLILLFPCTRITPLSSVVSIIYLKLLGLQITMVSNIGHILNSEFYASISGFLQYSVFNCRNSILDSVFSNLSNLCVKPAIESSAPLDPYYPALSIKYSMPTPVLLFDSTHEFYKFHKGHYRYTFSFN